MRTIQPVALLFCLLAAVATVRAESLHLPPGLLRNVATADQQQLAAGDDRFPVLYQRDRSGRSLGAVILLHGYGKHLNWEQEIEPLRSQLPDVGWATLSLPLPEYPPPLATGAAPATADGEAGGESDYGERLLARLRAAVGFLREREQQTLVLVGQNESAVWAMQYFLNSDSKQMAALALINADNRAGGTPARIPRMLTLLGQAKDERPVMDLVLTNASDPQSDDARLRLASALRERLRFYRQRRLQAPVGEPPAGQEEEGPLTRVVRGWLHSNRKLLPANDS